jgi:hypothetical protein
MTITDKRYPLCSRNNLLRQVNGCSIVSSAALHNFLGARYQDFIETITPNSQPNMGFNAKCVEKFIKDKALELSL